MKTCTRIPLKISFGMLVLDGALVHVEGSEAVKLFVKSTAKEMSFEVDPSLISAPREDVIITEINDYLDELIFQAKIDFPAWLEEYAFELDAVEDPKDFSIKSIREYWNIKQREFGIFRIAAEIGIITDKFPMKANPIFATSVAVGQLNQYTIKG